MVLQTLLATVILRSSEKTLVWMLSSCRERRLGAVYGRLERSRMVLIRLWSVPSGVWGVVRAMRLMVGASTERFVTMPGGRRWWISGYEISITRNAETEHLGC